MKSIEAISKINSEKYDILQIGCEYRMDNYGEIQIYQLDDGLINIEVKVQEETVWLSQQQMADLYQTSRTNVVEHVKHIYEEGELDEQSTCRSFRQVRQEGSREVARNIPFYNLDMIISLGYRIKSSIATRFRRWATERLKEYMIKGFEQEELDTVNTDSDLMSTLLNRWHRQKTSPVVFVI